LTLLSHASNFTFIKKTKKSQSHQTESREEAALLKNNALSFLQQLDAAYKQHFSISKLSDVTQSYQTQNFIAQNPAVIAVIAVAQDVAVQAVDDLSIMEDYIMLHIPQMEDGNNFGVTVQLSALKQLQDSSEAMSKSIDDLSKYFSARADAMDKLQLANETLAESKKEENDGSESKTTVTKETKSTSGKQEFHRVQAVYAVDTQYYAAAKKTFRTVKSAYVANIDFLLKNQDKIELPKGSEGGSNFSSMY
jgi:hypothetical protein